MITVASLFVFSSFYTLYYTSKRALLSYDYRIEKWIQRNPRPTKIISAGLLLLAYVLWLFSTALGTATLLFLIQLMTIGSLIVILTPLKVISSKAIVVLFAMAELLEFYYC
jgi:hypothetical protein